MKKKIWSKTKSALRFHYPSQSYYVNCKVGGKNWQRSCKTNVEKDALTFRDTFLATLRAPGGEEAARPAAGPLTLAPFIEAHRRSLSACASPATEAGKKKRLNVLESRWREFRGRALAEENPRAVTGADFLAFFNFLAPKYIGGTARAFLGELARIFELVEDSVRGYEAPHRDRRFKLPKCKSWSGRDDLKLPSEAQFAAVIVELGKRRCPNGTRPADLACALAYTGLRIDEARRLRREHVDLAAGYLVLTSDIVKGGQKRGQKGAQDVIVRRVPLGAAALALFTRLVEGLAREARVFSRSTCCNASLARACATVGCAKLTHHSLRHWFATLALERTKDAKQVSEWLGHRDGGKLVWQLYGHTREENEKKLAEKLDFNWTAAA